MSHQGQLPEQEDGQYESSGIILKMQLNKSLSWMQQTSLLLVWQWKYVQQNIREGVIV